MRYAVSILIISVVALLTLGVVTLSSAPAGLLHNNFGKHLAFCVLGILACVVTASRDYGQLRKISWLLYLVTVLLLVGVLAFGITRGGARRWYNLGFMLFQPSELAKLALIVTLAHYVEWSQRQMHRFSAGLLYPLALTGLVMGLVLLEPDFGTTVLLGAVAATLLFLGGVPWQRLVAAALLGLAVSFVFIYFDPVRWDRLRSYFAKSDETAAELKNVRYHSEQSIIAIGSGGWTGVGLGEGLMKTGSVPENHTDFIYSIIGEELGLAATVPVVLAYLAFFLCGLYISWHARDGFGLYLGLGVAFLIALQALMNIGVVTGVLPNKGLPLPFVSYGGSSLVFTLACVGLLLNVARHAAAPEPALAEALTFSDLPAPTST
jgi:cell division protein FtsW